jgi:hypothetical protein
MSRLILISVLIGYIFVGFEGLADNTGPILDVDQDHSHEVHNEILASSHEHDGDEDHDDHFCHCSAHAVVLLSLAATTTNFVSHAAPSRFVSRFSSRAGPPLLRPPNT